MTPTHAAQLGDTYRDHHGRLWIYVSDNVASCFWKRGLLWAWIKGRHQKARRKAGIDR